MAGIIHINTSSIGALVLGVGDYLNNTATGVITDSTVGGAAVQQTGTGALTTVTNAGRILATASADSGVSLQSKGTVSNSGTISATGSNAYGIKLNVGGSVNNSAGGLVQGGVYVHTGGLTLVNYGTIASPTNAIDSASGGTITNASGALISGEVLLQNAPGKVLNNGTILATGPADGYGIQLGSGGSLTNSATGIIEGRVNGVAVLYGNGSLTNNGTIQGLQGSGVLLQSNSSLVNRGLIEGYTGITFGIGSSSHSTPGTIDNFGTIIGTNGIAVVFANGAETLKVEAGSVIQGNLAGFQGGDKIDLSGIAATGVALSGGTLSVLNGFNTVASFGFTSAYPGSSLVVTADGHGGTYIGLAQPTNGTISGTYDHTVVLSNPTIQNATTIAANSVIAPPNGVGVLGLATAAWTLSNLGTIQALGADAYGSPENAVVLNAGGQVSNAASGLIDGANFGVYFQGATGTVINDGHITGPVVAAFLASGGAVTNHAGGLLDSANYGVFVSGGAGTITNNGTINSNVTGVYTVQDGLVTNAGTITGVHPIILHANGTAVNLAGGVVSGGFAGIEITSGGGTVNNLGTIEAGSGRAVYSFDHAVVTNGAANAVIMATGSNSNGIVIDVGSGTVTNYGTVSAGQYAVQLRSGGTVINGPSSGGSGVIRGAIGVSIAGGAGTVLNAGVITGTAGTAVTLDTTFGGRVILDPGAVFNGAVSGGNAATATLELASAASAGVLAGFGTTFVNFGSIAVDAGANWSLSGNTRLASGTTLSLSNFSSLSFSGTLDDAGSIIGSANSALSFAGGGLLIIEQGAVVQATIGGFLPGATIDLAGISATSAQLGAGNTLIVQESGGGTLTLNLSQSQNYAGYSFNVLSDGSTGSDITLIAGHPGPTAHSGTTTVGHNTTTDLTNVISGLVVRGLPGDTETITAVTPTLGSVTLVNGDVRYTAPSSGPDTLSYTVTDENGNTASSSLTVAIDAGPLANTGTTTVGQHATNLTSLIAGLVQPGLSGDTETVTAVHATHGVATVNAGIVSYTPPPSGSDTLSYTVTDQFGDSATGSVNVTVDPGPIAATGSLTMGHHQTIGLTGLISGLVTPGLGGDTEMITAVSATKGSATLTGGNVTYTAQGAGSDTVSYTVTDQYGDTATGSINVTVDKGPSAGNTSITLGHGKTTDLTSLINGLVIPGLGHDKVTVTGVGAAHGSASMSGGVISYTTPSGGTDAVSYTVTDQYGDVATGSISVTVDPGPTAIAGTLTIGHNQSLDLTTLISALVTPGLTNDSETISLSTTGMDQGSTSGTTYTAPSIGPATVSYTATDQYGDSASNTISVTVDRGPGAASGATTVGHNQTTDLTSLIIGKLVTVGLPGDTEKVIAVSATNGKAAVSSTGVVTYISSGSGTDTLRYTVADQYGDVAQNTVAITISPGPTAGSTSTTIGHDTTVDLTSTITKLVIPGAPGDKETITAASSTFGTVGLTSGDVTFSAPSGSGTLTYTVTDAYGDTATGSVAVTVDPGPQLGAGTTTVIHNKTTDLTSLVNGLIHPGLNGDTETVIGVSGHATLGAGGVITYAAPSSGTDSFTYTVKDQYGDTATNSVTVTIEPGPTAGSGTLTLGHNQTANLTSQITGLIQPGLAGDTETLIAAGAAHGTASLSGGVITYTSPASGTDTVSYTVQDQFGDTATGSIVVTVDPGPTAHNGTTTVAPSKATDVTSLINGLIAPGLAGDNETVTVTAAHGSVIQAGGVITYTAPASGADTLSYTVVDQYGDTAEGTVSVTLTGSTDPGPTANAASVMVISSRSTDMTSYLLSISTPGLPGDTLKLTGDNATGTRGQLTLSNGALSYLAPSSGTDSFGYTVGDQLGNAASAKVAVTMVTSNLGNVSGTLVLGAYSGSVTFGTGNVTVFGDNGNVVISGGSGTDVVTLGNGNDVVTLGNAATVKLGNGNDVVTLGAGIGVVTMGNGNDVLNFSNGSGTVTLGSGNDVVNLGSGVSTVTMGNGNDVVNMSNGHGTVTLGNGNNVVNLGSGASTVTMGNGNDVVNMSNGSGTVTLGNGNDVVNLGSGPSTVTMGNGNDTLNFSNGYGTITLGNGNDVVNLGSGTSTVTVGNGNNTLNLGNGSDKVTLGTGSNTVNLGSGNSTVAIAGGSSSSNTINVGNGNNTLTLGSGNYTANVGSGSDTIILGNGKYNISAGSGTDLFIYSTPSGQLTTSSFGSNDELVFRDSGFDLGANEGHGTASLQTIAASLFSSATDGTFATTANRFAYDASSGKLYYDADGSAAGSSKILIANLTSHPHLTAASLFFTS